MCNPSLYAFHPIRPFHLTDVLGRLEEAGRTTTTIGVMTVEKVAPSPATTAAAGGGIALVEVTAARSTSITLSSRCHPRLRPQQQHRIRLTGADVVMVAAVVIVKLAVLAGSHRQTAGRVA